jgi:hypothetical protein
VRACAVSSVPASASMAASNSGAPFGGLKAVVHGLDGVLGGFCRDPQQLAELAVAGRGAGAGEAEGGGAAQELFGGQVGEPGEVLLVPSGGEVGGDVGDAVAGGGPGRRVELAGDAASGGLADDAQGADRGTGGCAERRRAVAVSGQEPLDPPLEGRDGGRAGEVPYHLAQ